MNFYGGQWSWDASQHPLWKCPADLIPQNRKPFMIPLPSYANGAWACRAVWPRVRPHGATSAQPAQCAWGSSPWPRPSICLSSSAKLQGTTHYRVILLIGPLSSLPHSWRVPPYSVRMEYACKPPSMKRLHQGPPSFSHVKAQAGKYCAFKLKYYLERWAIPKP